MKNVKLVGLFAILVGLFSFGFTSERKGEIDVQNSWKLLNEIGYSIQYPENWDLNKTAQFGMSFILLSQVSSEKDKFRENLSLMIQDLSNQKIDLDKYVEISEGQIKTMITDGSILESTRITLNGLEVQKVIYTGKQGVFNLKFEQYYFIEKEKAFILTFTCEENEFIKYQESGEKIMNSFKLK